MNGTKDESYRRACCFIDTLFLHTDELLKTFDYQWGLEKVAQQFRIQMTAGQTMREHNKFREKFYGEVVRIAKAKFLAKEVCLL